MRTECLPTIARLEKRPKPCASIGRAPRCPVTVVRQEPMFSYGSMASVQLRPVHVGSPDSRCIHSDGPAANGRQGYQTGFCFCVLGCPLKGYFARLNINSRVTPAGVRGFVNFNSSSV